MLEIDLCPRDAGTYHVGQLLGVTMDNLICLICQVTNVDADAGRIETSMHGADMKVVFNLAGQAIEAVNMAGDPVAIGDVDLRVRRTDFPADMDAIAALSLFLDDFHA